MNLRTLAIIAVSAVFLALPMLIYGPMLQGHDTYEHINYSRHFSEQFWSGDWYPRWLTGMNHGLGSPSLFVYPPLPSYVYTLLEPAGSFCHFDAFRMGEFLALFGSGITAFLWLETMVNRSVALLGAVLYMLMPYHLAVDYYRRTALSECWALVWMPLVLYFSAKLIKRDNGYLVGLAIAYAMLILSHLVSVFMFSLIPLAFVAAGAPRHQKLKSAFRVATAMLLGAGLSSFYLVSALAHAKYFPVSRLPLWANVEVSLVTAGKLLRGGSGSFIRLISLCMFDMVAVCIVCSCLVLTRGRAGSKKKVLFWLVVGFIPVLLMHGRALRLWNAFPLLFAAVQYPWRFNIVLCVASLPIIALFLSEVSLLRSSRTLWLALFLVSVSPWLITFGSVWSQYRTQTPPPRASLVSDDDGWFDAWCVRGMDAASALRASTGPQVRFVEGSGSANVLLWKPRHIEIQTSSLTGGRLMINQFYYPLWKAALVGGSREADLKAALPEGLLEIQVPPGLQQVRLEIPVGASEYIGRWISGICVLLSLALAWMRRRTLHDIAIEQAV